jgi:hypothetical protein
MRWAEGTCVIAGLATAAPAFRTPAGVPDDFVVLRTLFLNVSYMRIRSRAEFDSSDWFGRQKRDHSTVWSRLPG